MNWKNKTTKASGSQHTTTLGDEKRSIRATYYPQDPTYRPIPLLKFEMSLPTLVYGDNIQDLSMPSLAIEKANQIIGRYSYIPKVDLNQGILYRVDPCYNFQVGGTVHQWIRQLEKLKYPWRKTKPYYPTQGVQYYSKKATLSFYDKEAEAKDPAAHGILRMEASWMGNHPIGELVGKQQATIGDFTSEVVVSLLNAELDKLGIKDRAPVDSLATLRILTGKYGSKQGMRLYGHMNARQVASDQELIALGVLDQTIWRSQRQIKKAGLSMCIAENKFALPKLEIIP